MHTDQSTPGSGFNNEITSSQSDMPPVDGHPELDGRNKEWEDRARVNLEVVPEGVTTNIERDFEPEHPDSKEQGSEVKPAY